MTTETSMIAKVLPAVGFSTEDASNNLTSEQGNSLLSFEHALTVHAMITGETHALFDQNSNGFRDDGEVVTAVVSDGLEISFNDRRYQYDQGNLYDLGDIPGISERTVVDDPNIVNGILAAFETDDLVLSTTGIEFIKSPLLDYPPIEDSTG